MSNRAVTVTLGRMTRLTWRTGANLPARRALGARILSTTPDSGSYFVGTTQADEIVVYNGQPASRRVSLFIHEANGFRLIRQTWSDPLTGSYSFNAVKPGLYLVLADDYLAAKNAVVSDGIVAIPMP